MSYSIHVKKQDGSEIHKQVLVHGDPGSAERVIHDVLRDKRRRMRNKGWSPEKDAKLVAQVPQVVWEYVVKRDGPEASRDLKHVIRTAKELGFNVGVR